MTDIKFFGYSDDTFVADWEGGGIDDDDCGSGFVRTYHVTAGGQRMAVTGVYGKGCEWSVGIAPVDEDDTIPDWPMAWSFEKYSANLVLTVPDPFEITLKHPIYDKA